MTGIGAPPEPGDLRDFPRAELEEGLAVYRVHRAHRGPWWCASAGHGRFDLPSPRGTCYAARSPVGAFIETLGDVNPIPQAEIDDRRISGLVVPKRCRLADVTNPAALGHGVILELSAGIRAGAPYQHTQPWAEAFADAGFGGLVYNARHDPSGGEISYALFDTEGEHAYPLAEPGTTPIRQELVESVRERCGLVVLPTP